MWEETLIESKRRQGGKPRWLTATVSVGLHVLFVVVVFAASFWVVEAVPPTFPPSPYIHTGGIPQESIPVVIKRGTSEGNDRPAKQETPVQQVAEVTQQTVNPNSDIGDSDVPVSSEPFTVDGEETGSGAFGFPEGNSDEGSLSPLGGGEPEPIFIQTGVEPPVLVHRVQPEYPETMRRLRIQGIVILKAVISRTGDVEVREVLKSVHPMLDSAAVRAVNQWKYRSATVSGRPVRVWFTVTVSFRLQ